MNKLHKNCYGFTLVELMITLAISGIIIAAVYSAYISQQRVYLAQEQVAEMQQNARVAMDMLTRDIRSAGFDPNSLGAGISVADPDNVTFTREDDLSANGLETINYSLYDAYTTTTPPSNDGLLDDLALWVTTADGTSGGRQVVAENISQLEFRYLDKKGEILLPPIVPADIRSILVFILAVANRPDPNFNNNNTTYSYRYTSPNGTNTDITSPAFNDNLRRRLFVTSVKCRNLGL